MKDRLIKRIVLAYSGSLDSSAVPWLAGKHGAEIVAVTIDLGQGRELEAVRDRALAGGALRAHVLDVRDDFAKRYLLRALKAGALYDGARSMVDAIGLPLIAKTLVDIAAIEQATAIAHGASGYDSRIGVAVQALNLLRFQLKLIGQGAEHWMGTLLRFDIFHLMLDGLRIGHKEIAHNRLRGLAAGAEDDLELGVFERALHALAGELRNRLMRQA